MTIPSNNISDYESEMQGSRRGRPAIAPELILAAANAVFAGSDVPASVTMDAVAAAAGIGKGTLFRAFGTRDGLLDALWANRIAALRHRVESGEAPFSEEIPPSERLVYFLDAILTFKLENRHLIRAREISAGLLQSPHYQWMHGQVRSLISCASGNSTAEHIYTAHALLAALHIDLIEEMLANGLSLETIRHAQGMRARSIFTEAQA